MKRFSTPAILLRRINFGDDDLILSLFTLSEGKVSVIAKHAKKSTKRFSGMLELFSALAVVCSSRNDRGLPVLQEAALEEPFFRIRADIRKTAYASYWAEVINEWMEPGARHEAIYHLLVEVLRGLNQGDTTAAELSVLFQIRFMAMSGFLPDLTQCTRCRKEIEMLNESRIVFDVVRGGLVCRGCAPGEIESVVVSKGTIKQLRWIESGELSKARRIRFAPQGLREATDMLEAFVPYHLGKKLRSLKFLNQIRKQAKATTRKDDPAVLRKVVEQP